MNPLVRVVKHLEHTVEKNVSFQMYKNEEFKRLS